jgi:polysaccharide biosynthesis protein PslH
MRLLYFAQNHCWPPTSGARLRNYFLARELASRCSVTLAGIRHPGDPASEPPPPSSGFVRAIVLEKDRSYTIPKLVRGLLGPLPVTVLNYSSARVARSLAAILDEGEFDIVQIEVVHLMSYLPVIRSARSRPAVLADWHNIESELMRRYAETAPDWPRRAFARRTAALIESAELRFLQACDTHVVASARERDKLLARHPLAGIHVVPNGVDVSYYSNPAQPPGSHHTILFVGMMDYHANIDGALWFVQQVWPGLHRRFPHLRFAIVGRNPTAEVRGLASAGVIVTGTVPDVRPFYADALAVVVPLRIGSGTRLKILEAMAAGVPVVSTRLGAEGLDVEDGREILLADTAADIIAAVDRLAADPELRGQLAGNARALVRRCYDWSILGEQLFQIHAAIYAHRRR